MSTGIEWGLFVSLATFLYLFLFSKLLLPSFFKFCRSTPKRSIVKYVYSFMVFAAFFLPVFLSKMVHQNYFSGPLLGATSDPSDHAYFQLFVLFYCFSGFIFFILPSYKEIKEREMLENK